MSDLRAVTVGIDDQTRARIERLAIQRDETVDALYEEALCQFADREESRSLFQDAALASWAKYCETGHHATADEVDAWLRRLETGDVAAPPRCHD